MHITRTFKSARALAVIERALREIEATGQADTQAIAAAVDLTQSHTCTYLRHMAVAGLIHCVCESSAKQSGRLPALWGIGAAPDAVDERDDMPRRVVVRAAWPAMAVRDSLVAALFGAPVLQRLDIHKGEIA